VESVDNRDPALEMHEEARQRHVDHQFVRRRTETSMSGIEIKYGISKHKPISPVLSKAAIK